MGEIFVIQQKKSAYTENREFFWRRFPTHYFLGFPLPFRILPAIFFGNTRDFGVNTRDIMTTTRELPFKSFL
ncbi:hypothetical protein CD32_04200 [Lysinibacillus odysseyi 34hs-1 = NBRC 100172]|uniref:Uncharacterized protein n=1 Tax=Lysinibacillus odysseyi 34hs-1 = NBRC 100172 TaxID=1220589 RepID=A0A0A3IR92_9BACI|nr:hypothetical protein CD32_04200 [Lysinibacillus odysseyi 34hs-1 = NBRC 100172]